MAQTEQYEVWALSSSGTWDFIAGFPDLDVATAVANARTPPVKVTHTTYRDGRRTSEEVLLQIGSRASTA